MSLVGTIGACTAAQFVPGAGVSTCVKGTASAVKTTATAASFASDPFGYIYDKLQDAAKSLADTVLPAISHATLPDLTLSWFVKAYEVSFGLAIFVLVLLLIPQIVRTARGIQAGRDLVESLTLYAPLFLIGAAFGPALGAFLVSFFSALSDSLISWGITASVSSITANLAKTLALSPTGIAGGEIVGCALLLLMLIGLLAVVLMLVVQLVTLYFSGVLFPLGFVWIIDPTKRRFGSKIAYLWFGILASHPLLFFMLSITYLMLGSSTTTFTNAPTLKGTVTLMVSVLAFLIAAFSPGLLARFAPVLPTGGGGQSPSMSGGGSPIGPSSTQDADKQQSSSNPSTSSSDSNSSESTTTNSGGGGGGGGEQKAGGTPEGPSLADIGKGSADAAGTATGKAGAEEAGKATGKSAGTKAAGTAAAESATGIGAVVGAATIAAAAVKQGVDKTKDAVDNVSGAALSSVDEAEDAYRQGKSHGA